MQNSYPQKFIEERISRMTTKFTNNQNQTRNEITQTDIPQNSNSSITTNQNIIVANSNNNQNSFMIVQNKSQEVREKEDFWVPLPYVGNISNKVGGYLRRKLKWKVTFTPGVKVQNLLNGLKDKEEKDPAGIYKIPCGSCDKVYLGETFRSAERRQDHEGNVRRYEYKKSAVARHVLRNKGHKIDWNNSKIIIKESNSHLRSIKEGLAIQQYNGPSMNINQGLILSRAWTPIIPNIFEKT